MWPRLLPGRRSIAQPTTDGRTCRSDRDVPTIRFPIYLDRAKCAGNYCRARRGERGKRVLLQGLARRWLAARTHVGPAQRPNRDATHSDRATAELAPGVEPEP